MDLINGAAITRDNKLFMFMANPDMDYAKKLCNQFIKSDRTAVYGYKNMTIEVKE